MNLSPIVHTTLATVVRTIATTLRQHYGIDPLPVLADVGIDPAVMEDGELRLPITTLSPLWLRSAEVSGDPAFGLRAVRFHRSANLHGLDLALFACASLREAVERQVQLAKLLSTAGQPNLRQDAQGDWHLEFLPIGTVMPTLPARDFYVLFHIRMFERLAGVNAPQLFRQILFSRDESTIPALWHEVGVELRFSQPCAALVFRSEHWERPLPGANPRLLAQVEQPILQHLAQLGMPLPLSALRAQLAGQLAGEASVELLAANLGLPVNQLQQTLRQHGLTFAQLLDQTREAQTLQLLANPAISLEQIAERVGFSSATGLAKAFRRWQDSTPMHYRREVLGLR